MLEPCLKNLHTKGFSMNKRIPKGEEFGRVAVLMGGTSSEREISLQSGKAVLNALQESGVDAIGLDFQDHELGSLKGNFDRVVIMLHGKNGEDGTVQGALDLMGIPYTGSGVMASALAMDKMRSKKIWLQAGLPTPDFRMIDEESDFEKVIEELGTVFVKPVKEGSSFGISKATNASSLRKSYEIARQYDEQVMAEMMVDGAEFTVPVLQGKALPAIELQTDREFYDYTAKYLSDDTRYICPCDLDEKAHEEIKDISLRAYQALGCTGWGRIDLLQDKSGKFWLIEANTVPGMTSHSLVPMSAKQAGIDFNSLVLAIMENTLHKNKGTK